MITLDKSALGLRRPIYDGELSIIAKRGVAKPATEISILPNDSVPRGARKFCNSWLPMTSTLEFRFKRRDIYDENDGGKLQQAGN